MNEADKREFVIAHRDSWEGKRALYREIEGLSVVTIGPLEAGERGVTTTCTLIPTPGLRTRPSEWRLRVDWTWSTFAIDAWSNPQLSLTIWFDQALIDAILKLVSQLHAVEEGADHSLRAWRFVGKYRRMVPNPVIDDNES